MGKNVKNLKALHFNMLHISGCRNSTLLDSTRDTKHTKNQYGSLLLGACRHQRSCCHKASRLRVDEHGEQRADGGARRERLPLDAGRKGAGYGGRSAANGETACSQAENASDFGNMREERT